MRLIDTHSHLYAEEFDADRDELIVEARKSGIETLLLPNIDRTSVDRLHCLCDQYSEMCYPMMGLHPTSVGSDYAAKLSALKKHLSSRRYCAIGEIGIDLYWDKTFIREQKKAFEEQLSWSIDYSLPVSIHTRDAFPEVFELIRKTGPDKLKGVFHSFTGSAADLKEILSFGNFKVGINGVITYRNSNLTEVLREGATIHDIVVETDAPYLPPVPYRGKRNEPVYMLKTVEKIAEVFGLSVVDAVSAIEENTKEVFTLMR